MVETISGPWKRLDDGDCDLIFHHLDKADPQGEAIPLFAVKLVPVAAPGFFPARSTTRSHLSRQTGCCRWKAGICEAPRSSTTRHAGAMRSTGRWPNGFGSSYVNLRPEAAWRLCLDPDLSKAALLKRQFCRAVFAGMSIQAIPVRPGIKNSLNPATRRPLIVESIFFGKT